MFPAATPMGLSRDDLDDDSAHISSAAASVPIPFRASVRVCARHVRSTILRTHLAHVRGTLSAVMVLKLISLFILAALLEIGGAWLVWQGVREHRGWQWVGAGASHWVHTVSSRRFNPTHRAGVAAYGGVFIAGSLAWGMVADGFRPDRWDIVGAPSVSPASASSCTRRVEHFDPAWPHGSREVRSSSACRHAETHGRGDYRHGVHFVPFHPADTVRPSAVVTLTHAAENG